jgi:hypothetical protein
MGTRTSNKIKGEYEMTKVKEITIREITHDCGHIIKTAKTKNIQCYGCGKRFDL